MRAAQEAEVRKVERAAAEATAARHAEALLAQEEAEKEAEERAKESKKGKKKRNKAKGGGGGAGPSREPEDESALAAEEAELAAAFDRSARLEDEARRAAEEQAPPAGSTGDSPSEEQPAVALSLADANFDTGRAAVPESTLGGETTFASLGRRITSRSLAGTSARAATAPLRWRSVLSAASRCSCGWTHRAFAWRERVLSGSWTLRLR